MRTLLRVAGVFLGVVIALQALMLWNATGGAMFTAYPTAARAQMQQWDAAAEAIFAAGEDPPAPGEVTPPPGAEVTNNSFKFGLLPAGADKHVASVMTIAGPAAVMSAALLVAAVRGARRPR
jgi:hypothetical protein